MMDATTSRNENRRKKKSRAGFITSANKAPLRHKACKKGKMPKCQMSKQAPSQAAHAHTQQCKEGLDVMRVV